MRIAVTGASGLIGSAVARKLATEHDVVRTGRNSTNKLRVDLANPVSVSQLDLGGVEALIHCAGIVDEDFKNGSESAFRHATAGTEALVKQAADAKIHAIAYISSAHIYGPLEGTINEASPPNPLSNYAIAHFASEEIFRRSAERFKKTAIFRPCAVYGMPHSLNGFRRWSLIPFSFPRAALTNHEIALQSSGLQRRNFVASDDIACCVAHWLATDQPAFLAANPVGTSNLSVLEFAKLCANESEKLTGKPCPVRAAAAPDVPPEFRYETNYGFCRGTTDLRQSIGDLLGALQKESKNVRA